MNRQHLSIKFGSDTLNVVYDLTKAVKITHSFPKQISGISGEFIAVFLSTVINSWDLTDDNNRPVPLSKDALLQLPFDFIYAVCDALVEDVGKRYTKRN